MSVYKPKNGKSWAYDFQIAGVRYTGTFEEATSKTHARNLERDEKERIRSGAAHDWASEMTLDEACGRWFEEKGQHRADPRDAKRALDLISLCIDPSVRLRDITALTVSDAIQKRRLIPNGRGGPPSNATINRQIVEIVRTILRRAQLIWGAKSLPHIVWKELKLKEKSPKKVEITPDVDAALDAELAPHWREFRAFLKRYGCRLDEMFFDPSEIWDGNDDIVRVRLAERKEDDEHVIPLLAEDGAMLLARKSQAEAAGLSTIWFTVEYGRLKPMTYEGAKSAFRRAAKRAGVKVSIHDHRHHAGTVITRAHGINTARKLLGHADIRTTQRYAHASDQDLLNALSDVKSREKSRDLDHNDIKTPKDTKC